MTSHPYVCIKKRDDSTALFKVVDGILVHDRDEVCVPTKMKLHSEFEVLTNYLHIASAADCNVSEHILNFLEDLVMYTSVSMYTMQEIFNGAFTVINGDRGYFHRKYAAHKYKRSMIAAKESSHGHHLDFQYRLGAGSMVACTGGSGLFDCSPGTSVRSNPRFDVLFGISKTAPSTGDTAFQFEKTRMDTFSNLVQHAKDYFKYRTKKGSNLGCFGNSDYTDARPLLLYLCNDSLHRTGKMRPCMTIRQ